MLFSQDKNVDPATFTEGNGYYITSEGLIIQWGETDYYANTTDGQIYTINFPISFPHKCFNVSISTSIDTAMTSSIYYDVMFQIVSFSNTSFSFTPGIFIVHNMGRVKGYYIAIGY